jgi:hypothetical protein
MLVRSTGHPVRTRDAKAKHISNLLHQPVRQPTDAVTGMPRHGLGTKAKPLAINSPVCGGGFAVFAADKQHCLAVAAQAASPGSPQSAAPRLC